MKRILRFITLSCMACLPVLLYGQLTEDFNGKNNISSKHMRSYLQQHCWNFVEFETDPNNWDPGIDGDGAMVSTPNSNPHVMKGIYTPELKVEGDATVKFSYTFNNANGKGNTQYVRIYLADAAFNPVYLLDSMDVQDRENKKIYEYDKTFTGIPNGSYRILINYGGTGLTTRIAIDKINISENMMYSEGCNQAPVAADDDIVGENNFTARGRILPNDYDPDNNPFKPYITKNPKKGTITLNDDNTFSFTPDEGFRDNKVTFKYRVCEEITNGLCSNEATVTIVFPNTTLLPVTLLEFSGNYKNNGFVNLNWSTSSETNSDRFVIERSTDGQSWIEAGTVLAAGNSTIQHHYQFNDHVGKNTALKQDLYYRLRQYDKDGKSAVSRIMIVRVYNTRSVKTVSVTPNPARSDIQVMLQLSDASMTSLKIMNPAGQIVLNKTVKLQEGNHKVIMERSSSLQPGMYILEVVINGRERMIVKLVKE